MLAATPFVIIISLAHVTAVFLFIFLLPIYPYTAYCPGDDVYIKGPYRDRYIVLLLWYLNKGGGYSFLFRGTVYAPALTDYQDVDWKLARSIVEGFDIDGTYFAPPERVVRLLKERGYADDSSPSMKLHDDCDLLRAAILPDQAFGAPAPNRWTDVTLR